MSTVIVVSIIVCAYELPRLMRKRQRKEIAVFLGLLVISVGLYAGAEKGVVPNPVYWMEMVYKPVYDGVMTWLK
ncbi:hypothetical protein [Brevibacillus porteri]|uniref:hypothetical protein n=1 Tax=Brevibacillus porteri TaxID=2126350 RepID=UPI003D258CDD